MYRVFLRSVNMVLGWQYTLRSPQFVFHECNFCRVYLCFEGSQGMKQLCASQGVNIYVSGPWVYYIEILEKTVVVLFASQVEPVRQFVYFCNVSFLRSSYLNIACDINFDDMSSNIHLWRNLKCFSRLCLCVYVCVVYDIDIQVKVHLETNSAILNFNRIRYRFKCTTYLIHILNIFSIVFESFCSFLKKNSTIFFILTKIDRCRWYVYVSIKYIYIYII